MVLFLGLNNDQLTGPLIVHLCDLNMLKGMMFDKTLFPGELKPAIAHIPEFLLPPELSVLQNLELLDLQMDTLDGPGTGSFSYNDE